MHDRLLILRQRHRCQNDDDRNDDHQLKQRETALSRGWGRFTSHCTSSHLMRCLSTLNAHQKYSRLPTMSRRKDRNKNGGPTRPFPSWDRSESVAGKSWFLGSELPQLLLQWQ